MNIFVGFKKISKDSILPLRAHSSDAGYDLFSSEEHWIKPEERRLVSTGICLSIQKGHYGRIAPRSGLAYEHGVDVLAGVIDSGYRDEIKVLLINLGSQAFHIECGERIAQIIFEVCCSATFDDDFNLDLDRGGGFGSTG